MLRPLLVACLVGALVALYSLGQPSQPSRDSLATGSSWRFAAPVGDRVAYSVEVVTSGWFSIAQLQGGKTTASRALPRAGVRTRLAARIHGLLELRVIHVDREASILQVEGTLQAGRYAINGATEVGSQELSLPFEFGLTPRGTVTDISFHPGHGNSSRRALESVVRGLQVDLPPYPERAWRSQERSLSGTYEVAYQLDAAPDGATAGRMQKRWIRRIETEHSALPTDHTVRESSGLISFTPDDVWVKQVRWSRLTQDSHDGSPIGVSQVRFAARRTAPSASFPVSRLDVQPDPTRTAEAPISGGPGARDPQPPLVKMVDIVKAFSEQRTRNYAQARDALLASLRAHPEAPAALARHLDGMGDDHDSPLALTLWRLLATAGTEEAQQTLVDVFRGNGYGEASRVHALLAVRAVPRASRLLIDGLWGVHARTGDPTYGPARHQNTIALFAIGTLGHRRYKDPELAVEISDQLATALSAAKTPRARRAVLTAIGNQGSARALPHVLSQLRDPDATLRSAAVRALRRVEEPRAAAALLEIYAGEPKAIVRASVLSTLGEMPHRDATVRWAREQLPGTRHPDLLVGLVRLLGSHAKEDAEVEAALGALLALRPPKAVRKTLYDYIRP